ncbi:MAG: class I SAM-dependent RNA methyltransferase [Archangiaceae bacterium]|nr:class I SAM-dependent RNA methyltransferase [Archangiaceae bacterium]
MQSLTLTVERLAKSGDGVAHHQGRTVFIEGALPGETVRVRVHEGKVLHGELLEVLKASPARRTPPCPLADRCGGCSWQHLDEAAQRAAKEEIVCSTLEHLGGLPRDAYALSPTVFGASPLGYRRRASLHPVDGGLGFHGRRSAVKVRVDLCPALVPALADLGPRLVAELGGSMKEVEEVRLLESGGRVGVALHLRGEVRPGLRTRAEALAKKYASVALVPAEGAAERFGDPRLKADGFTQANEEVNARLVAAAAEALGGQGPALELYAGSGNFTRALAPPVLAVEVVGDQPALPGVRWVKGDVPKVAQGLLKEGAKFERLLVDPPRAGAPGIERWAEGFGVSRIVYVACDPASLARDAGELVNRGWRPERLQLFDMFPQTHHVEALMVLQR